MDEEKLKDIEFDAECVLEGTMLNNVKELIKTIRKQQQEIEQLETDRDYWKQKFLLQQRS
jgi:uncharacterized protein YqhQ